jgi:hypothetical protein
LFCSLFCVAKLEARSNSRSSSRAFRAPLAREVLLFCLSKREVPKRKRHPAWRLPGFLPSKSVRRGRAFRTGILPVRKGADIHVDSRCAACRPRLTAAQGPRVEQRAILARTFQKSQIKSGASRFDPKRTSQPVSISASRKRNCFNSLAFLTQQEEGRRTQWADDQSQRMCCPT